MVLIRMRESDIEENFTKALLITIGYMALLTLLIFIPLIGPVLALTFGPYIAGYSGGRYSVAWRLLGLTAAIIWSSIFVLIFLFITLEALPFSYPLQIGGFEIAIICIPYILNIIFCVLGARAKFIERAVYV
jgi:hypothetical protein